MATAKRLLLWEPVGLLLSDVDLPDGNGLELCQWVRTQEALQSIKIIICSGRLEPDLEQRAFQAGAVACLAKPFSLDQFTTTVRSHIPWKP